MTNCPNCGAPIDGTKCSYCGTSFVDLTALDLAGGDFVKVRVGDSEVLGRFYISNATMSTSMTLPYIARGYDGRVERIYPRQQRSISLTLEEI